MANTITNLVPDLYEGLDVVSRELTGFIRSVSMENTVERASINDTVRIPITQAQAAVDNTPAVIPPDDGDQVIENETITITASKSVPIRWNGEQTKGIKHTGQYSSILAQQMAQAVRTLINLIEADIAAQYFRCSRAYGTAGTTPFASKLTAAAQIRKILDDNGAPGDRSIVIDTLAGASLRDLATLNQVNTSGGEDLLRDGIILPIFDLKIFESAQIKAHTKGTATSATTDATGYAIGDTVITLASVGAGTIVAGDVITFAGDTNKYLVLSGDTDVSNGGTITIAKPGLRQAITGATAITVGGDYTANIGFSRSAIHLATRFPALPDNGDMAADQVSIVDPRTGLAVEVALYKQYLQNQLRVRVAWGTKLVKPEHTAILLG